MSLGSRSLYELLGVSPGCSSAELRSAYRRMARQFHPDSNAQRPDEAMAKINEAWRTLSDPTARREYDRSLGALPDQPSPGSQPIDPNSGRTGMATNPTPGRRRQAWAAGMQAQMARLARQAGRSATQTALLKSPNGTRQDYELIVDDLVARVARDVENRVRSARAAGAAPLDLGVGATLVGVRLVADEIRREAELGLAPELLMAASLVDRMWDILAHELPLTLTSTLGGNPRVAKALNPS